MIHRDGPRGIAKMAALSTASLFLKWTFVLEGILVGELGSSSVFRQLLPYLAVLYVDYNARNMR